MISKTAFLAKTDAEKGRGNSFPIAFVKRHVIGNVFTYKTTFVAVRYNIELEIHVQVCTKIEKLPKVHFLFASTETYRVWHFIFFKRAQ